MYDYRDYSDVPNDFITKSSLDYDNERELYRVNLTECYNMFGTPVSYYFSSFNTDANPVWGEDSNATYTSAVEIMAYFQFPNRSRLYNQFGIQSIETFNVYISMDHFDALTGGNGYPPYTGRKPLIGDTIRNHYRDPFGYTFYEIANVNYAEGQFEQGQTTWMLTCKLYDDNRIKLTSDTSAITADDPIRSNSNQNTDIFDVSQKIDIVKQNTLYYTGSLEPNMTKNNNLNGWF